MATGSHPDAAVASGSAPRRASSSSSGSGGGSGSGSGSGARDLRHFRLLQDGLRAKHAAVAAAAAAAAPPSALSGAAAASPSLWSEALSGVRLAAPLEPAAPAAAATDFNASDDPSTAAPSARNSGRPLSDTPLLVACRRCQRTLTAASFQQHWGNEPTARRHCADCSAATFVCSAAPHTPEEAESCSSSSALTIFLLLLLVCVVVV